MTDKHGLNVVELPRVSGTDEMLGVLRSMIERVQGGEFASLFLVGIRPDGRWMSKQSGDMPHPLMSVGIFESLKQDVLLASKVEQ